MIRLISILLLITIILFSCNNNKTNSQKQSDLILPDSAHSLKRPMDITPTTDTIPRFVPDDYPVTNDMFGNNINAKENKSGQLVSFDKVWFTNTTLQQTLIFELYTDYHRLATYHFYTNDVPREFIRRIEFSIAGGDTATNEQKVKDFKGFLPRAKNIDPRYFTTEKKISLGDSPQKAMLIYGNPDKTEHIDDSYIYSWQFEGDQLYDGKSALNGKPLAKDSYGYTATLFFKNGKKLVAMILYNDIP